MSESLGLLTETAERLFADLAARRSEPFETLWPLVEETGFPALLVPEAAGGFGGDWQDAFAIARLAGVHAVPLPIIETIVAGALVAAAGWEPSVGLTVVAPACEGRLDAGGFSGRLASVPWGGQAGAVLAVCDGQLLRLKPTKVAGRQNTAGEPRDTLTFEDAPVEVAPAPTDAFALSALLRTAQIAGALDAALALSIDYVNQRVQFGKPLAKFQAMQQNLAVFAEEAAAVNSAGQAAARAADRGEAGFEIAAAKLRANLASGVGASIAHQAHGAIGFTAECELHHLTGRLIAWRSEYGGDRFWAERLGRQVAALGADAFWPELTRRADIA
jgi:acyl-CoA dehydrogenase